MKQLKFLMVALTLLMGISLTSCMGESDPTRNEVAPLKLVNTYPFTFQYPDNGLKVVATNSSELLANISLDMNYGDIILIQFTFNGDEQPITETTKEIEAKVSIGSNYSANAESVVTDNNGAGEPYENATINGLESGYSSAAMMYYDKNTLLVPIWFLAKSMDKHDFTLVYDQNEVGSEEDVLKLYLRHSNSEEKPAEMAAAYKAFDIRGALATYGKTPAKIRIYANVTDKSGSCDLADAKQELQYKEIEYKSIFEK